LLSAAFRQAQRWRSSARTSSPNWAAPSCSANPPHYADFALGAFGIGEDISAAAPIELRGGEKWWFFGLNYGHLSNAGTQDKNPGEEEVYISYSIPF
jgi:hypothetical protein